MSDRIQDLQKLVELKLHRAKLAAKLQTIDLHIEELERSLGAELRLPVEILKELIGLKNKKRKPNISKSQKKQMLDCILEDLKPVNKILIPLQEIKDSLLKEYGVETTSAPLKVFLGFPNEVISNRKLQIKGFDKRASFLLLTQEQAGLTKTRYKQMLKKLSV